MEKTESYLPIVRALEVLMRRALDLKVKKEDPYGAIRTFKISGIRIVYMRQQYYQQPYLNAVPGRLESYKSAPELLITLFYEGKEKKVNCPLSIKNSYLQTFNGILSSTWPRLSSAISELLDEFYGSTLKDQKIYKEYQVKEPPRMKDEEFVLPTLERIPEKFSVDFETLLRDIFLTECIAQVDAHVCSTRKVWIVLDSHGTRIIQKQDIMRISIVPYAVGDKKRLYLGSIYQMEKSFEKIRNEFPNFKKQFQEFLYSINRKQLPSGIYPLIFEPSATATLFHEAIAGHMLSGAYIVDETSTIFKGKLGKSVSTDMFMPILKKLQISDCPLDDDMLATYRYDMEGVPAKNVLLINKGVLKNYLLDRNSAARMGKEDNGHALAEDFQQNAIISFFEDNDGPRLPEPRVSNLKVISDSKTTFKDLEDAYFHKYGYYILVKSYAGEVNVSTGTFELHVDYLTKVYPDGKKEYFHGGTFSSNMTDFVNAIKDVSNKYGITSGYCGSDSGWVPTQEYTPATSVYGINWAPVALPEPIKMYNLKRDKYIPKNWEKTESYEFPSNLNAKDEK